jgi:hypothetical protein
MTTSSSRESAQIYQFPARGRFASAAVQDDSKSVVSVMSGRVAQTTVAGAWYHDAAIQDAERARKS